MFLEESNNLFSHRSNYIFNEDDIEINLKDFINGYTNVLLITGYSGSGKSTLSKILAKKYHSELVELDEFNCYCTNNKNNINSKKINFLKLTQPVLYKYLSENSLFNKINNLLNDNTISDTQKLLYYEKEISKCIDWIINKYNKRVIIEGVDIAMYIARRPEKTINLAIIFKGTSKYVSMFRMIKRDFSISKTLQLDMINEIKNIIIGYDNMKNEQDFARYKMLF